MDTLLATLAPLARRGLLHSKWGLDIGDDTADLTSDDVPGALDTQRPDDPDEA